MIFQVHDLKFCKVIDENCLRNDDLMITKALGNQFWPKKCVPIHVQPPDLSKWPFILEPHDTHVLLKNWKQFAQFYSLKPNQVLLFEYVRVSHLVSHLQVAIFDQCGAEIAYPVFSRSLLPPIQPAKQEPKCYPNIDVETSKAPSPTTKPTADSDTAKPTKRGRSYVCNTIEREVLEDTECSTALEKAKAFRTKNPSFIRQMRPSSIQRNVLSIPSNFITTDQQKENESAILWVSKEKTWHVKFKHNPCNGQTSLNAGWKNFVTDNNLKLGDVLVFERSKSMGVSLRVVIFRAREESSPPQI